MLLFWMTTIFTTIFRIPLRSVTVLVIAPIALTAATNLGVEPRRSPYLASPVNILIMGPGNYEFKDYMRAGIPILFPF